jgi:prepilin-type N-terminal cleavage/methylation domain-containing protein
MIRRRKHLGAGTRRGVTLVELIVAMSILTVGLLAVAGVSGSIARSLGESRGETLAATAAMTRFEKIAGKQCSTLTLGTSWTTEEVRGITEKYRIQSGSNNTLLVEDSVFWVNRRGTRRAAFTTILPCRVGA